MFWLGSASGRGATVGRYLDYQATGKSTRIASTLGHTHTVERSALGLEASLLHPPPAAPRPVRARSTGHGGMGDDEGAPAPDLPRQQHVRRNESLAHSSLATTFRSLIPTRRPAPPRPALHRAARAMPSPRRELLHSQISASSCSRSLVAVKRDDDSKFDYCWSAQTEFPSPARSALQQVRELPGAERGAASALQGHRGGDQPGGLHRAEGRGLHSSTFRLNVSTFCWIRWVHDFPPVYPTGGHREV